MTETIKAGSKYPPRHCENCGRKFAPNRRWHKFCSTKCRVEAWYKEKTKSDKLLNLEERIISLEKRLGEQWTSKRLILRMRLPRFLVITVIGYIKINSRSDVLRFPESCGFPKLRYFLFSINISIHQNRGEPNEWRSRPLPFPTDPPFF